jgi:hypothetical protein
LHWQLLQSIHLESETEKKKSNLLKEPHNVRDCQWDLDSTIIDSSSWKEREALLFLWELIVVRSTRDERRDTHSIHRNSDKRKNKLSLPSIQESKTSVWFLFSSFIRERKLLLLSLSSFSISPGLFHRDVNDNLDDNGDTFHDCYDCVVKIVLRDRKTDCKVYVCMILFCLK